MKPRAVDLHENWGLRTVSLAMAALLAPSLAMAQTGAVVNGRVTGAGGGPGIQNAIVQLEGSRPTLTAAGGAFRFEGVEPGEYQLQVEAFGRAITSRAPYPLTPEDGLANVQLISQARGW